METFLVHAEDYVVHHEHDKTAEQIFAEFIRVEKEYKKFNAYLRKNKIKIDMPRKSEAILERRKLFINWYIQKNGDRYLNEVVEELTTLVFASETTIHNIIYNYR